MIFLLPSFKKIKERYYHKQTPHLHTSSHIKRRTSKTETVWSFVTCLLATICLFLVIITDSSSVKNFISPLVSQLQALHPLDEEKNGREVFGFAPWWNMNKLDDVDFNTLTTFAYFGIPVTYDGSLDRTDDGYRIFKSDKTTQIFKNAHNHGTRVVLTVTQMDNDTIDAFLSSNDAKQLAVREIIDEVKDRGIDGVNVDFEYVGNPGAEKRESYTDFIAVLSREMKRELPNSRLSISVYALSVRDKKLYDIKELAQYVDRVFMMAYDFAVTGAENAMPTAPLYGKKQGKYYYDVATAVADFTAKMPAEKLILGVPYYGYNYLVVTPKVKAATRSASWRGRPAAQTYAYIQDNLLANKTGWDNEGQVGWKAYYVPETGTWRMVFIEDVRSLGIKYDFAKSKNLAGVGMWALGMDHGKTELWSLLREKFGINIADSRGGEVRN